MDPTRVLELITIVLSLCKPSFQDVSFIITRTKILNRFGETHTVHVEGNGIDAELKLRPLSEVPPVLMIPKGFILGDPRRHLVTAFTDSEESLVLVRSSKGRQCVYWTPEYHGVELYRGMSNDKCQQLVQSIIKAWDDFKEKGKVTNTDGGIYVLKTKRKETKELDMCLGSVRIVSYGVDYTMDMTCSSVDTSRVVFMPDAVVVNGPETVYIKKNGQIITIKDSGCERKTQGEYVMSTSHDLEPRMTYTSSRLFEYECKEFREIVTHYLDHPPADIKIKRTENNGFYIDGNGVLRKVTVPEAAADNMQLLHFPGGFALGDWVGNQTFVYSDTFNTLVEVTSGGCTKATFKAGKSDAKIPTDCGVHLKKMADLWRESGMEEAARGFTVHRHSYDQYGLCQQDIMVEGRGVETRLGVSCECGDRMKTVFTDTGVVVGDYRRHKKTIVVEGLMVVVVENGKCKRRYYAGDSPRVEDVEVDDCQRIKRKMETAVERNKKGYLIALDKRNKEFIFTRKSYIDQNEICQQEIQLTGNGIVEELKAPCVTADHLDLLFLHGGFLLGDYRQDKICLLAVTPRTMAVINRNGSCEARVYKEGEATVQPVNAEDCQTVKKFVEITWNDKRKDRYWTRTPAAESSGNDVNRVFIKIETTPKTHSVLIVGNGIFEEMSFTAKDDTTTLFMPGGFILGDFEKNTKYIYSNEPNTLFVVQKQKNTLKCRTWKYTGRQKSDYATKDKECQNIDARVKDIWNARYEQTSPTATLLKGINIVKRLTTTNDGCKGYLTIQGDGMDRTEPVDCAALKTTEIFFTPNGVVVGDPERSPVSFFSDQAKSLVVVKEGTCSRTRYFVEVTRSRSMFFDIPEYTMKSNQMKESACNEVKKIISGYWTFRNRRTSWS